MWQLVEGISGWSESLFGLSFLPNQYCPIVIWEGHPYTFFIPTSQYKIPINKLLLKFRSKFWKRLISNACIGFVKCF